MKILVSGSSGLVGSSLVKSLEAQRHDVYRLVRSDAIGRKTIAWDPDSGKVDRNQIGDFDAVVHLAGESIATGRWTQAKKVRIRDSRVIGTRHLATVLTGLPQPPNVFVSASAIGYYGNRGDEILDEDSSSGNDFLASVCREWEEATQTLRAKGVRVMNLRFGIILSTKGGALPKMLTPFKWGVGGVVGNGKQFMSWVALKDAVVVIQKVIEDAKLQGPINVVAPQPVTNLEFTKTLGKVLSRPTIFPLPAFAARLVLGEMADALLLSSCRVLPKRLLGSGYQFVFPDLESCLRNLISG